MHIFPDAICRGTTTHTGCKYLICYPCCNVACRFSVECERDFPNFVLIDNCLSGKIPSFRWVYPAEILEKFAKNGEFNSIVAFLSFSSIYLALKTLYSHSPQWICYEWERAKTKHHRNRDSLRWFFNEQCQQPSGDCSHSSDLQCCNRFTSGWK